MECVVFVEVGICVWLEFLVVILGCIVDGAQDFSGSLKNLRYGQEKWWAKKTVNDFRFEKRCDNISL